MNKTILSFEIEGVGYGMPLEAIREVCLPIPCIAVPKASPVVQGLINLRGDLVLLLDMAWWLHGKAQTATASSRILLMKQQTIEATGFLVDSLGEVRDVHGSDLGPVVGSVDEKKPTESAQALISGLCKWGDRTISMIDPQKMPEELAKIMSDFEGKNPKGRQGRE